MRYRRSHVPGASYFFTVNLEDRSSALLIEHIDALRAAMRLVRSRHPFRTEALVVMPDHVHAIWTLPPGAADFATRWGLIKAGFSRAVPRGESVGGSRVRRGERGLWQRRFWEHLIRDEADFAAHVDYIHLNPVKHGYVGCAADWRYSSLHRYVAAGVLPADWGGDGMKPETATRFGER